MRIVKAHDERREEIVDAADKLFRSKGYDSCTINDILRSVSIAKGTFYHYFKSKEDVLDAVVDRYASLALGQVHEALQTTGLRPADKLLLAFQSMSVQHTFDDQLLDDLHDSGNALMHQKSLYRMVTGMGPILAGIVEEGSQAGAWRCRHPLPYMRIFLAAALSLMDEGIFQADADFQRSLLPALISVLEKMLEVPDDTFLSMVASPE
jgi:AcrR family transcriptional regulator